VDKQQQVVPSSIPFRWLAAFLDHPLQNLTLQDFHHQERYCLHVRHSIPHDCPLPHPMMTSHAVVDVLTSDPAPSPPALPVERPAR